MLAPHPRLYTSGAELDRLRDPARSPMLQAAASEVAQLAEQYADSTALTYDPGLHNALLSRAREMQRRVVTLLVRWRQTGDGRFRMAAMDHLRDMARWEYWCWEASLAGDRNADLWFDLSSGENGATLAIAYDWLHETLTEEERSLLVDQARARCLQPFVNVIEQRPNTGCGWWFGSPSSNWNTVCAGGAGMLALAMYEEFPILAEQALSLAEPSIRPYFEALVATDGGWVEGIGYWNYGHRYGFLYLFSHENATGRPHPSFSLPGVRETLSFPLDFVPNGQFCSFPDVNSWAPAAWHYKAAVRLDCAHLIPLLDEHAMRLEKKGVWADEAEFLTLHPRTAAPPAETAPSAEGVAKLYPGMDWAILADRMPNPGMYMAIRGGSTKDPHSMVDVLSFQVVIGAEKLIHNYTNSGGDDYMSTTFSQRRNDIFEIGQPAKNVPFLNGVGLPHDARVETRGVRIGPHRGFRLDATKAYGIRRNDKPMVEFAARLFLMLETRAFLIIDRFELPETGRAEVRLHSFAEIAEADHQGFLLQLAGEHLRVLYACDVPAITATAVACPTKPVRGANILRWCTLKRTHRQITMATLLVPGAAPAQLALTHDGALLHVEVAGEGWQAQISTTQHLEN